jgi:hypothetical protein
VYNKERQKGGVVLSNEENVNHTLDELKNMVLEVLKDAVDLEGSSIEREIDILKRFKSELFCASLRYVTLRSSQKAMEDIFSKETLSVVFRESCPELFPSLFPTP